MKLKTTNRSVVEEVEHGMYVWQTPDGEILGDGDGNVMNAFVWQKKDRPAAKKAIADAARHYGFPEGEAIWWSGKRPLTDEQYEEQLYRESQGLVPDPLDIGAIRDEERALKQYGRA